MSALERLDDFRRSEGKGAFPHIERATVAYELSQRLDDPSLIDQAAAGLCGPASFLYALGRDRPGVFVDFVCDLYDKGAARIGSMEIKPSDGCRAFRPNGKIAVTDWIMLGGLRDSENSIFSYEGVDNNASGITMPHSMVSWFRAAGYKIINNKTNVFFTKGEASIREMIQLYNQGHRVCAFVNDNIMYENTHNSRSVIPNHWVTLEFARIDPGEVRLQVWSWGSKNWWLPKSGLMPTDQLTKNLYGYVSALP